MKERTRVLVLYSDIGEGHVATARALAAEFSERGPEAEVTLENGLAHMGRFLQFLQRDLYHRQLTSTPWLYGFWYGLFAFSSLARAIGALVLCLLAQRPLLRLVRGHHPDVIVSTDPRVSVVLGHLRLRKKIDVPVCATLTDLGGLEFWVHPGVDVHLISHPDLLDTVEELAGRDSVALVRPPVHPRFLVPIDRSEARGLLGFPRESKVILLSGGGWGAGDISGALGAALRIPEALVVCLCGRNASLKTELDDMVLSLNGNGSRVRVLGFTDSMSQLLAASDVLVHATGGATCLEASVRRCPVIVYGAPPGHTRHVARAMARLAEGSYARSPEDLLVLLRQAANGDAARGRDPRGYAKPTDVILAAQVRRHSWADLVVWLFPALRFGRRAAHVGGLGRHVAAPERS